MSHDLGMTLEFLSGDALESELAIGGRYISPELILEISALCERNCYHLRDLAKV
jgi:hypothetical protein